MANPLSSVRVETMFARSTAGFGIAFTFQAFVALNAQTGNLRPAWTWTIAALFVVSLGLAAIASLVGRWVRTTFGAFALLYVAALATWPLAVIEPANAPPDAFWLYFIMTVAHVASMVAFPLRWATVYLFVPPALYVLIRILPVGGAIDAVETVFRGLYALILGGVVLVISTIIRGAARDVDRAQRTALERYTYAVRHHATEAERVQVDAIVHDSVLTTLLSAARAYTPEAKELATTMAANAIGHLREASRVMPGGTATVSATTLAGRILGAAETMSQPIGVSQVGLSGISVPVPAAEALYSAAVQAMVNSLQHAGDAQRWVTITGVGEDAVEVEIGDDGAGFDFASVPDERLGVRVSIVERVATAGGRATIDSSPGNGTRISLTWPEGVAVDEAAAPLSTAGELA